MKFYEFAETDKHLYQIMFSLAGVETMQPPNEAIMEAGGVVKEIIKKYTSKDRIDIEFLKWWAICQGFISINLNPEIKPDQAIMKKAFKQTVQIFIAQL